LPLYGHPPIGNNPVLGTYLPLVLRRAETVPGIGAENINCPKVRH
jgi:hypothetical protein